MGAIIKKVIKKTSMPVNACNTSIWNIECKCSNVVGFYNVFLFCNKQYALINIDSTIIKSNLICINKTESQFGFQNIPFRQQNGNSGRQRLSAQKIE